MRGYGITGRAIPQCSLRSASNRRDAGRVLYLLVCPADRAVRATTQVKRPHQGAPKARGGDRGGPAGGGSEGRKGAPLRPARPLKRRRAQPQAKRTPAAIRDAPPPPPRKPRLQARARGRGGEQREGGAQRRPREKERKGKHHDPKKETHQSKKGGLRICFFFQGAVLSFASFDRRNGIAWKRPARHSQSHQGQKSGRGTSTVEGGEPASRCTVEGGARRGRQVIPPKGPREGQVSGGVRQGRGRRRGRTGWGGIHVGRKYQIAGI